MFSYINHTMPNINPAIPRGLTNWQTACELNASLQSKFSVRSETEYRARLQGDPRPFDAAVKEAANFQMYWPVTPCVSGVKTSPEMYYTPSPASSSL